MKTYVFTKYNSPTDSITYIKTEAELTEKDKEMLLGELIVKFENAPLEVQLPFLAEIRSRGNIDWNTEMW